jgi:hypothetical protein
MRVAKEIAMNQLFPSTDQIQALFLDEITARGGHVSDTFHDGKRLFLRSVFPRALEVRPADRMQGGVALRAVDEQIVVHPYVFRQVCTNGAIFAQAIGSCEIERVDLPAGEAVLSDLAFAIRSCSEEEVFAENVNQMRMATSATWVSFMPLLSRMPGEMGAAFLQQILERFPSEDQSGFGFMNAVTSVARDTRDPEKRWRLEELGGGIAAQAAVQAAFGEMSELDNASMAMIA